MRNPKRPAMRGRAFLICVALFVPMLGYASADRTDLREIGTIPFGAGFSDAPTMVVDSTLHRGYTQAFTQHGLKILIYDLEGMKLLGAITPPASVNMRGAAVDEANHRIFFAVDATTSPSCRVQTGASTVILVFDQIAQTFTAKQVECLGESQFTVRSLSYDPVSRKLYAAGIPSVEEATEGTTPENRSVRFRQMDPETMKTDWDLDADSVCDNANNRLVGMMLARSGDSLVSYCYRNTPGGYQGLVLRIPLEADQPVVDPETGGPVISVGATLPGPVAPLMDPDSGRLVIFTEGSPNGQAVWVYDPSNDRFFGVIPSGVPQPRNASLFLGLNRNIGRAYILNARGIVIADFRHNPLPGGVSYRVLDNVRDNNSGPFIAVDTKLRRLFVPVLNRGFVVLQDDVPEPADPTPPDPDRGTADIPEEKGKTEVAFSSAANAFGMHVLNTGGAPRAVNNLDPLCNDVEGGLNDKDAAGRCPADVVLSPGNREYFLSQSIVELGSDSGTSAFAAAGRSPSSDSATDSDLRAVSSCEASKLPDPARTAVEDGCPDDGPHKAFKDGTRGEDGRGFPVAGSFCTDFQRKPDDHSEPGPALGASSVSCDYAGFSSRADSNSSAISLPLGSVKATVGHSASTITTKLTETGMVTSSEAIARDIDLAGVVQIGEVKTTAVTTAKGRSGTTGATFTREIRNVKGPGGFSCQACRPEDVVGVINRVFGPSLRARMPDPHRLASPRGYQGVVAKDPRLKDSDRAVNDDDTDTVNGLDLIAYNDGNQGRSRMILSLAGVQTESRFGIFPLPESSPGDDVIEIPDLPSEVLAGGTVAEPEPPKALPKRAAPRAIPLPRVVRSAFELVVNSPKEFGILFLLWLLLAAPVYLGLRRRSLDAAT